MSLRIDRGARRKKKLEEEKMEMERHNLMRKYKTGKDSRMELYIQKYQQQNHEKG